MTSEQLKYSILKIAYSGKLVPQKASEQLPNVKQAVLEENPFDIPDTWIWSTLENCCNMYTGNSISQSVKKAKYTNINKGLDYIATKDVTFENTIEYNNGVRIPIGEDFRIAKTGSILMCIEGGSAGRKIGIIDKDVCFGNKLCMFNSDTIENKYIFFYLQSNEFKKFFTGNMSGIIGGVSIKKLKELPIPIPPLEEQHRIVAKIEELLPFIDRYAKSYEKLEKFNAKFPEDMKKSILQYAIQGKLVEQRAEEGTAEELFEQIINYKAEKISSGIIKKDKRSLLNVPDEKPFDIPESWKWVNLGSVLLKLTDGTHKTPKYVDNGVKFVSVKNISSGKLSLENTKYISTEEHNELYNRCNPEKGDLLLSKVGTTGVPAIIETDESFSLFVSVALLKFNNNYINIKYLYYLLLSPLVQNQAAENTRGIGNKNWVLDAIGSTLIVLPPYKEQERIVIELEKLLPYCDQLIK